MRIRCGSTELPRTGSTATVLTAAVGMTLILLGSALVGLAGRVRRTEVAP